MEEKPNIVIVHAGINDLLSARENIITQEGQIFEELMKIGNKCKEYGVETVFISGITFCRKVERNRIKHINEMIKSESKRHGFIYVDHGKINGMHM